MANLRETSVWEAGIYQLETSDPVMGGENGIDNRAPRQLANRTLWLKNELARQIELINNTKLAKTDNAVSASKFATARNIAMTGDGSWNVNFDGSQNATGALTLANSGVTAGSYNSVTVDAKGRVTAGLTQTHGLVTATTAQGTANVATGNGNTFLNIVASGVGQTASVGSSTQITGANGITVSSDTAGKLIVAGTRASDAVTGVTQLSHETNGTDKTKAASEYALGEVRRMANQAQVTADGIALTWNNVQNKPATFTPSSHTHAWGQITGVPSATTSTHGITLLNDTLTSTANTQALTARQGKILNDKIDGKDHLLTVNYPKNRESNYAKSGFYRSNGATLGDYPLPSLEVHITHPEYDNNAYARGLGFDYGHQGFGLTTTAWDKDGTYLGQRTILTQENGVMLSGEQEIRGTKTFLTTANLYGGLKVASSGGQDGGKFGVLNANDNAVFIQNGLTRKFLELRHNGDMTYDGQKIWLYNDRSDAIDLDDTTKIATAKAVKRLNDEKLGNTGQQTINGQLGITRNAWEKMRFTNNDGSFWRFETAPVSSGENGARFNWVFTGDNGSEVGRISFPRVSSGETIAYQSWVQNTNVASATKLQTARNIAMTGDGVWNVNFDGTQNATGTFTLANSGVTAGSYNSVTVDAKGRVTAGLTQTMGLITATTATGTANSATGNNNTFLNIVASGVGRASSVGSSTQITGTNGISVSSDTAGKLIVTRDNNSPTATKLQTARNIALTGAVTGSVNFDGSGNVSLATTVQSVSGQVVVMTGTIEHGQTIPLPAGFSENQCKWLVSIADFETMPHVANNQGDDILAIKCHTTGRTVTAQVAMVNTSRGRLENMWKNISANYIIIGVK